MNAIATGLVETGIKAVDLYAPLARGGSLAIGGDPGAGQLVLALEIAHNVCSRAGASCTFWVPEEPDRLRSALREAAIEAEVKVAEGPTRVELVLGSEVLGTLLLGEASGADSWIVLTVALLKTGQIPAVDASRSGTSLDLGTHGRTAEAAREAVGAATGSRAGLVLAFLRQWFHVGEPWTGQPAECWALDDTLAAVSHLLGVRGERKRGAEGV